MKDELMMLLGALNTIEVYGKKNVGTLYNCINHVENMIANCDKPQCDQNEETANFKMESAE